MSQYQSQQDFLREAYAQDQEFYYDQVDCEGVQLKQVTKEEMKSKLHKNITAIIIRKNNAIFARGSGLLISRNLVLTCAHNLKHMNKLFAAESIDIYPGVYGPFNKPYKVESYKLPKQFLGQPKHDYALIKLTEKVNSDDFLDLKGSFSYHDQQLAVFGYPEVTDPSQRESAKQFGLKLPKAVIQVKLQKQQIIHSISTKRGQSGSPIIEFLGNTMSVIGIHKGGYQKQGQWKQWNNGKLLTQQTLQMLKCWVFQLKAEMFRISPEQHTSSIYPKMFKKYEISNQQKKRIQNIINQYHVNQVKVKTQQQEKINTHLKSTELNPNSDGCYNELANAYLYQNKIQQAINCYKKAIQLNPYNGYVYSGMGDALKAQNKLIEALNNYLIAIQLSPKNVWAYIGLANTYKLLKNNKSAHENFAMAIEINPNIADPYNQYGNFLFDLKQIPSAIQYFRKAVELDQSTWNCNGLGGALNQVNHIQQALEYLIKSLELSPLNSYTYYNLGLVLEKMQKYQQALWFFQKCLELNPNYPDINLKILTYHAHK